MPDFCKEQFISLLNIIPERRPLLESPEYSAYLLEHVFIPLKENGHFDLAALDWDILLPRHLIPEDYAKKHEKVDGSWAKSINSLLHKTAAAPLTEQDFF